MPHPRAPELMGSGGWIGTGESLTLAALRGKVVVLHFWAFGNALALRTIEELRPIEQRYPNTMVVVGVHSPKFPHEADHEAVELAAARHQITHLLLDDPDLVTWQQYGVKGWPTLVVIAPTGRVTGLINGADDLTLLSEVVSDQIAESTRWGILDDAPTLKLPPRPPDGPLAFPSKLATDWHGRLAIADTGHDRVVIAELAEDLRRPTRDDPQGAAVPARITDLITGLHRPQGVCFDGDRVIICDTGADRVLRVDLAELVADEHGIGRLRASDDHLLREPIGAPWDVTMDLDGSYVVAEAAFNRLWRIREDGTEAGIIAGTGVAGIHDGRASHAELAQPTGLARLPNYLAFCDSDTSALRVLSDRGKVSTIVGEGSFDWGFRDGMTGAARLQHPTDVCASPDGSTIYVADTYNSAIRFWRGRRLSTLPTEGLKQPGGIENLGDGRLIVADTNNHRVVLVDTDSGTVTPLRFEFRPVAPVPINPRAGDPVIAGAGESTRVYFEVDLEGRYLDPAEETPVQLKIDADPSWLLAEHAPLYWEHGAVTGSFTIPTGLAGRGTLTVSVAAAACGDGISTVVRSVRQHPLVVEPAQSWAELSEP